MASFFFQIYFSKLTKDGGVRRRSVVRRSELCNLSGFSVTRLVECLGLIIRVGQAVNWRLPAVSDHMISLARFPCDVAARCRA